MCLLYSAIDEYNILSSEHFLLFCQKCVICQPGDVKKGAAKQSSINTITE